MRKGLKDPYLHSLFLISNELEQLFKLEKNIGIYMQVKLENDNYSYLHFQSSNQILKKYFQDIFSPSNKLHLKL